MYRVLRGQGEFVGERAYEEFRRLEAVFRQEGPGLLVHPVWPAEQAFFVELTAEEEPLPDYARYRFAFWEDWEGYSGALTENDDGGTAPWQGEVRGRGRSAGTRGEKRGYPVGGIREAVWRAPGAAAGGQPEDEIL